MELRDWLGKVRPLGESLSLLATHPEDLSYLCSSSQVESHARNLWIAHASAPLIGYS